MTSQIPSFNNRDKLSNIRNKSLNPAIQKVNALELNQASYEGRLDSINTHLNDVQEVVNRDTATLHRVVTDLQTAERDLRNTFTYATVDGINKLIEFAHRHPDGTEQGQFELDLSGMFAGTTEAGVIVSNEHTQLRGVNNAIEFTGAIVEKDPVNPKKAKVTVAARSSIEGGIYLKNTAGDPQIHVNQVKGVAIKGNLGDSNWKDGRLEIDLPHLTVRDDVGLGVRDVEAIRFAGANVTKDPKVTNGIIVDTSSTISVKKDGADSHPLTMVHVPADSLSEVKNSSGGTSQELTISQMRATVDNKEGASNKAIDSIHIEDKDMAYITGQAGKTNELHIKKPTIKVSNTDDESDSYDGYTLKFAGAVVTQDGANTVKISGLGGLQVQENGGDKGGAGILNFEEAFQYDKPAPGASNYDRVTIKPMTIKSGAGESHNIRGFMVEGVDSSRYVDKDKYLKLTDIVRDGFSAQQLALNISHDGDVVPQFAENKLTLDFNKAKYQPSIVKALVNNINGPLPRTGSQILKSTSEIEFSGVVSNGGSIPNSVTAHFAKDAVVNEIVGKIDSGSNVTFQTKPTSSGVTKMLVRSTFNATIENGKDGDKDQPFDDIHIALPGSTVIGKQLTIRGLTAEDANGNEIEFTTDDEGNPHNVVGCLKAGEGITLTAATEPTDRKAGIMTISAAGGSGSIKGKIDGDTSQNDISKIVVENGEWADGNETLKIKATQAIVGGNSGVLKKITVLKESGTSTFNNGELQLKIPSSGSGSSGITIAGKGVDGTSSVTQDNTKRISYGDMFSISPSGSDPNKEVAIAFNKGKLAEVLYNTDASNTILKAGSGIGLGLSNGAITITNTSQGGGVTPAPENKVKASGTNYGTYDKETGEYTTSAIADTPVVKLDFGKEFDISVETEEGGDGSTLKVELADTLTDSHYAVLTTPPVAPYTAAESAGMQKMPFTMLLQDPRANIDFDAQNHIKVKRDGVYDVTVCTQVIGEAEVFNNLTKATLQVMKSTGTGDAAVGSPVAITINNPSETTVLPKAALHTFTCELVTQESYYISVQFGDLTITSGKKAYTPAHMNYVVIEPKISKTKTGYKLGADNRALMSGLFLTPGYAVSTYAPSGAKDPKARVAAYSTEVARKTASIEE